VIDIATNKVTAKVRVGISPSGVAVNPTGTKAYVANYNSNNVSIIDTSTNKVIDTVEVGERPVGVAVTPDGTKVYVANEGSNNVSVIDTATNSVICTVNVGKSPIAFGQFMGGKSVLLASNFSDNVAQVINEVTEADNGKTICLRNGDIFYLGLPENPTTGYSWELNLSQGLVLLSEKSILTDLPLSTQEVGICGMGDFHLWKIKANSGGSYHIKGIYARFWEPDPAETYVVNLTVTNEKHCRS
jgi:YVTN family beta-propeller protein